jgi:hypothetical protein
LGDLDGYTLTKTRFYKWFLDNLRSDYDGYKNFGWFTEQLHNAVLDEPPPYRSDIKDYLSNLISWVKHFEIAEIEIEKFNHTEEYSYSPQKQAID